MSFFGSVPAGASASAEYKIALNSADEADARTFLRIEVAGTHASLKTPELPDGVRLSLYQGDQSAAALTTTDELERSLRSHLGSNGWSLAADMPFDNIDPGSDSYLNQVFNVFPVFKLGPQVRTATIFTAREVFVPALDVPEPNLVWLVLAGMSMLGFARNINSVTDRNCPKGSASIFALPVIKAHGHIPGRQRGRHSLLSATWSPSFRQVGR